MNSNHISRVVFCASGGSYEGDFHKTKNSLTKSRAGREMSRVSRPCGPNAPVGVWATPQVLAPALGAAAGEEQAAFLGELLEARPAPTAFCVFTFAARTLKRHRSIPGPPYRCGKSTFKSSLWATPGGKGLKPA